ncbi:ABC-type amino acid transport/signal transduction system [Candidatus Bealeia paramacronuclearis]|uniref:ABC-type amino acid transport/signal transduction system n=1 Tax=Candidatus Bealeia paramacronuclearis TaxID=1921001 RepID=A0ABZ2CAX8_9PROT|nr:ABC-type amino acid transport/signal transduction system [Candidatus Bealeia paramacronuclearis]
MKKTFIFINTIFLSVSSLSAAETSQKIALKACTVMWPPFITKKEGTQDIEGPDTEILKLIASRQNYEISIQEVPWKRCLNMAQTGDVDIVFSASDKAERREFLLYPKTQLHTTRYVFAVKPDTKTDWATSKDPKSLPQPVGSVLGYSVTDELKGKQVKVDDGATTDPQNVDKFFSGRINSFVIEESVLNALLAGKYAEDKKSKGIEILKPPYEDSKNYYITISKTAGKSPEAAQTILKNFEGELEKMSASGEIKKIYEGAFKKVE